VERTVDWTRETKPTRRQVDGAAGSIRCTCTRVHACGRLSTAVYSGRVPPAPDHPITVHGNIPRHRHTRRPCRQPLWSGATRREMSAPDDGRRIRFTVNGPVTRWARGFDDTRTPTRSRAPAHTRKPSTNFRPKVRGRRFTPFGNRNLKTFCVFRVSTDKCPLTTPSVISYGRNGDERNPTT